MPYTPRANYTQKELLEMEIDDWQQDFHREKKDGTPRSDYALECLARIGVLRKRLQDLED